MPPIRDLIEREKEREREVVGGDCGGTGGGVSGGHRGGGVLKRAIGALIGVCLRLKSKSTPQKNERK